MAGDIVDIDLSLIADGVIAAVDHVKCVCDVIIAVVAAIDHVNIFRQVFTADIGQVVDEVSVQAGLGALVVGRFRECQTLLDHIVFVDLDREAAEFIIEIGNGIGNGNDCDEDDRQQTKDSLNDDIALDLLGHTPQLQHISDLVTQSQSPSFPVKLDGYLC